MSKTYKYVFFFIKKLMNKISQLKESELKKKSSSTI